MTNDSQIPSGHDAFNPGDQADQSVLPHHVHMTTKDKKTGKPDPVEELPRRFKKRPSDAIMPSVEEKPVEDVDPQLVDQTKNQIRNLVQEIADLAKTECSVEDFYEGFLTRTTSALASIGGAVWVRDSDNDPLKLQYHINLKKTKLAKDKKAQVRHGRLLKKLADSGEPTLVGPDSGATGDDLPGNPTEYLLIVGPLKIDNQTIGLVEIFQRPGAGPTTQRGYVRFLMQMCEIASDFFAQPAHSVVCTAASDVATTRTIHSHRSPRTRCRAKPFSRSPMKAVD